jgi:hypothetical protein
MTQTPILASMKSSWQQYFARFQGMEEINSAIDPMVATIGRVKQTPTGSLFGGLMKKAKSTHFDDGRCYCLADEKTITFDARKIQIECLRGVVWVTWPDGNERVLKQGQAMAVVSKGLICVQAFAHSTIMVRSTKTAVSRLYVPCRPAELPAR